MGCEDGSFVEEKKIMVARKFDLAGRRNHDYHFAYNVSTFLSPPLPQLSIVEVANTRISRNK